MGLITLLQGLLRAPYRPSYGPPQWAPQVKGPMGADMHLGHFSKVFSFHITVFVQGAPNAPTRFPRALSKKLKRWTGAPVFNK